MNHFEVQKIIQARVPRWEDYEAIWKAVEQWHESEIADKDNIITSLQKHLKEVEFGQTADNGNN